MLKFALLALATVSLHASAVSPVQAIECQNHAPGEDTFIGVRIEGGQVFIETHETTITAAADKNTGSGFSRAIVEQVLPTSSEGVEYETLTSALLVYNEARKVMNTTLILDGNTLVAGTELNCK